MDRDEAIEQLSLPMHPGIHTPLMHTSWVRRMREATGQDLFVYRHEWWKNFVLAVWTRKPPVYGQGRAYCHELCTMSGHPETGPADLPSLEKVRRLCRRSEEVHEAFLRTRREEKRQQKERLEQDEHEKEEAAGYLGRKGYALHADALRKGVIPFTGRGCGGGRVDQLAKDLMQAVKAKVAVAMPGRSVGGA